MNTTNGFKTNFTFHFIDPRPQGIPANDSLFAQGPILGIEVTLPQYAKRCMFNIDPQHLGKNAGLAAIEMAASHEIDSGVRMMATVRPDLDSIGSMAIINLRDQGEGLGAETLYRIEQIANFDKFSNGHWEPKELPSDDNFWAVDKTGRSEKDLAGLNLMVMDHKLPLIERVAMMQHWLLSGVTPQEYEKKAELMRAQMIIALQTGDISYSVDGLVAKITSSHMAATSVGYCLAPILVLYNPSFNFISDSEPIKKYTVCQYGPGYVDMEKVRMELLNLEAGWGGQPNIIGSPQGISSELPIETVAQIVSKHIL